VRLQCTYCKEIYELEDGTKIADEMAAIGFRLQGTCSDECETALRKQIRQQGLKELYLTTLEKMPDAYRGVKLSDFDDMEIIHALSGKSVEANDMIKRYCNSDYWNLTLGSAQYGNGKTRLGLYVLARLKLHGFNYRNDISDIQDAGYFSAIDICKALKTETFERNQHKIKVFCRAGALMIDDLGQEDKRDSGVIAGILKVREENKRKTIITTNLNREALEERYTGRISSRIAKGVFNVIGKDHRE